MMTWIKRGVLALLLALTITTAANVWPSMYARSTLGGNVQTLAGSKAEKSFGRESS